MRWKGIGLDHTAMEAVKMVAWTEIDGWCKQVRELLRAPPSGWLVIACDDSLLAVRKDDLADVGYCVSEAVRSGKTRYIGAIADSGGA